MRATVEAATWLLPASGADRYNELGVFTEDENIPLSLITLLWGETGGMDPAQARALCRTLADLSLITLSPEHGGRVTLHDVYRDYLRAELGSAGLTRVNASLVTAVARALPAAAPLAPSGPAPQVAWWDAAEEYLRDHAIEHLLAAGQVSWAENLARDLRWIEMRLGERGPNAPWDDLARVSTPAAVAAASDLARINHLLQPIEPAHALPAILHSRLQHLPAWREQVAARQNRPGHPAALHSLWPLPDLEPGLLRGLTGHSDSVNAVAISPDGTWLATAGVEGTVRVWDRASCTVTTTRSFADVVTAIAISPDGSWIAAGERDVVRLWDRTTGASLTNLPGHSGIIGAIAIAPDGTWFATADEDAVRIWARIAGTTTVTLLALLRGAQAVAISADGTWIATAGAHGEVDIRDRSGNVTARCSVGGVAGSWRPRWRSPRTGPGSPRSGRGKWCASGTGLARRPPQRFRRSSTASRAWRSLRTGPGWPPLVGTARQDCGTVQPSALRSATTRTP